MVMNSWVDAEKFISESKCTALAETLHGLFSQFVEREQLDAGIFPQLIDIYIPLAAWVALKHNKKKHSDKAIVIGVNGAQGSGKSTLSGILQLLLNVGFGKSVVNLSIDDLYLSRQRRQELAEKIHPLLQTRGVPGTHDVKLGLSLISELKDGQRERGVLKPVFDKAQDELLPQSQWEKIDGPVDIILFEGWCVGSIGQCKEDLDTHTNTLEQREDQDKKWRTYVNQQLNGDYQELFGFIDHLLMLKVPDMAFVYKWRKLQESKLKENCRLNNLPASGLMSEDKIERFIMHYERITQHTLNEMPDRADIVMDLDEQHRISGVRMSAAASE